MAKRSDVVEAAIAECERFVRAAKAYRPGGDEYGIGDSKGRAAAKRASMDASHALAKLRQLEASEWDRA